MTLHTNLEGEWDPFLTLFRLILLNFTLFKENETSQSLASVIYLFLLNQPITGERYLFILILA